MYIQLHDKPREIEGKLYYHAPTQAWCIIKLKKDIIRELGHLTEKRGSFSYEMKLFNSVHTFEKEVKKIKEKGKAIPILLWIKKDEPTVAS